MTTPALRTLTAVLALTSGLPPATFAAAATGTVEHEITQLEQVWNDAYGANNLPKYFSYYTESPLLVFYNKRTTLAEYRQEWAKATKAEPLESARISDLKIQVNPSGDTAIASYQLEVRIHHPDGKTSVENAFETDVWFKGKDAWRVSAVHYSSIAPN